MVIVEFYDKNEIENVCAGLMLHPDKIIFIGSSYNAVKEQSEQYSEILSGKGICSTVECKSVNKNNMQEILDILSEIAENESDVVFDLTGGDETYLTAAGIVFERFKDKHIQLHRFNLFNNTMQDCDLDGNVLSETAPAQISVDDNIRIYGGTVVYDSETTCGTYKWVLNGDFKNDINEMWNVCRTDVKGWNKQIDVFSATEAIGTVEDDDNLTTVAPVSELRNYLGNNGNNYYLNERILKLLYKAGLIYIFANENELSVTYKNHQVKRCLTKAGQVLEMKVFLSAKTALDKNGEPVYNDVMNGVHIDWNGNSQNCSETENEVDVMMMRRMIPVFVSCKNGKIEIGELYKLSVVAERFGGKYAKKVLVETSLGDGRFAQILRNRAAEMNIRIVSNLQDQSDVEINRIIRSLWSN